LLARIYIPSCMAASRIYA